MARSIDGAPVGRAVLMVTAFAVATPISFWSVNAPRGASGGRMAAIAVALLILGLIVLYTLSRFTHIGRAASLASVIVLSLLNWRLLGSPIRLAFEQIPIDLAPLPIALGLGGLVWAFGDSSRFQLSALAMGAVMALSPLPGLIGWYAGGSVDLPAATAVITPWTPGPGDVYFVVLDGFGRPDVLEDMYGLSMRPTLDALENRGFTLPADSRTNYSSTVPSFASALLIGHVGSEGLRPSDRERVALHRVIGGYNPVVESFKASGYRYVHVESGWDGARCTEAVDECVSATFTDELVGALLERSAFAWLFETRAGHAFTINGLRALDDLIELESHDSDGPRLIVAHVVLPHPPLLADQSCEIAFDRDMIGGAIGSTTIESDLLERRMAAYGLQVECVSRRLREFVRLLEPEDTVVVTGDHGPDSFAQLSVDPTEWPAAAIRERMAVFTAVRIPGCENSIVDDWMVVGSFIPVIECLSGEDLPAPSPAMFAYPLDSSPGVMYQLRWDGG